MQSDVGDSVVSIAIEISHNAQLFKLNQNEPLEDIIKNICDENGFEYARNKYSLQFVHRHHENDSNLPHYVTEENRYRIKNGSELKLFHSASEFVNILQTKLSTRIDKKELSWALSKLSVFSSDATFASEFFFTGYPLLRSVIEESSLTTNLFNNCLRTFLNFIKLGYITELDEPFLIRLKNILNSEQVIDEHIIENSLQLLDAIIYTMNDISPNFITINELIPHIWNRDSPAIQGYAIALINGLALKLSEMEQEGDLLDQMNSLLLRENILKNVISSEKKSSFMSHNLYVYQTLILSLELTRFNKLVSENTHFPDIELNYHYKRNKFKSFSDKITFKVGNEEQGVKCPPKRADRERSKTVVLKGSSSNLLMTQFDSMKSLLDSSLSLLQKDDFSNYDVGEDLNISLNQMTHDCIIYFAHNYRNEYRKTLVNEFHLRFLKTCCQVTDFLVKDILKIGQPPSEDETLYYPLVFSATVDAPFFEELFSCAMILLAKTRKEMNAKTEADLEKVFQVFKRQLNEGLASQPHSFNQLSSKLSSLTYSVVSGQWQEERCEKEKETFAKLPSIKQLRESLINETLELIKTQRINYLIKGTQFPMWNAQRSQVRMAIYVIFL
uniref:ELMO armadillo-like helical domain-containing protein n=1 Tax=Clastoptera arizonana TaxID=38151 RepID=A0A1B6DVD4_9HEMI